MGQSVTDSIKSLKQIIKEVAGISVLDIAKAAFKLSLMAGGLALALGSFVGAYVGIVAIILKVTSAAAFAAAIISLVPVTIALGTLTVALAGSSKLLKGTSTRDVLFALGLMAVVSYGLLKFAEQLPAIIGLFANVSVGGLAAFAIVLPVTATVVGGLAIVAAAIGGFVALTKGIGAAGIAIGAGILWLMAKSVQRQPPNSICPLVTLFRVTLSVAQSLSL